MPRTLKARIDHDCKLIAVLERFEEHHVKLNVNKMRFLVRRATFIGHVITTDGLQPNPMTLQAVAPCPLQLTSRLSADSWVSSTISASSVLN